MINKNEIEILSNLRRNARQKLTTISKRTKIPVSTIFDKIKSLEAGLIIKKHSCLVNFSKLGFEFDVYILLKVSKDEKERLKEFLVEQSCLNNIFKSANNYDFIVEGIFKNMRELQYFLDNLEEKFDLIRNDVVHILDELKREEFMNKIVEE